MSNYFPIGNGPRQLFVSADGIWTVENHHVVLVFDPPMDKTHFLLIMENFPPTLLPENAYRGDGQEYVKVSSEASMRRADF